MDISFNVLNYALLKTYKPFVEIPPFRNKESYLMDGKVLEIMVCY